MSHINDRDRLREEIGGFNAMSKYAKFIKTIDNTSEKEPSFAVLNRHLQEEARARVSTDNEFKRLYQPFYIQDLHVGNLSKASNEARDEALRNAITFGNSIFNNIGIDLASEEQLHSVDQIAVDQIEEIELDSDIDVDDLQFIADSLEPQAEEQIKFIVVPEDKFVKLEDYNQLAELVVQMNERLKLLEAEKYRLESIIIGMKSDITSQFIVQTNELNMYVDAKTKEIQYLFDSKIDQINNQNLIQIGQKIVEPVSSNTKGKRIK